eukprot:scaffold54318_cov31-Prasinocladus_malaysianus.AAC.1
MSFQIAATMSSCASCRVALQPTRLVNLANLQLKSHHMSTLPFVLGLVLLDIGPVAKYLWRYHTFKLGET